MVEIEELRRELRVMKAAGIGGVEINPIGIAEEDNDMGKRSLRWLSDEWIEALQATFDEAKQLDMTCDLIVGSGWPFGGEFLEGDERAQVVLIDAHKLEGPTTFEISKFAIFKTVDPGVTVPFPGRTFELLSLKLVPNPMDGIDQVIDLSDQIGNEVIRVEVPEGKYVFLCTGQSKCLCQCHQRLRGCRSDSQPHGQSGSQQVPASHVRYDSGQNYWPVEKPYPLHVHRLDGIGGVQLGVGHPGGV